MTMQPLIITSNTDLMQWRFKPDTYSSYVWHEMIDLDNEVESINESFEDEIKAWTHKVITDDDIDIDHDEFCDDLVDWLTDWIIDNVNPYIADFPSREYDTPMIQFNKPETITMYSPQYYNFGTDSMNVEVQINDWDKLIKFTQDNKDELDKFLEKYSSRDGFVSFTPSSYRELMKIAPDKNPQREDYHETNDDTDIERFVMCIIDFMLKDFDENPYDDFDSSIVYEHLTHNNLVTKE